MASARSWPARKKFRTAIHERFAREVEPDGPERLYVSRSALGLGKGLLGEELLESLLEREGYEIFHPQKHPMQTQIARYKAARQIVAADGSALHLYAMVGRADQRVAMISRRESGGQEPAGAERGVVLWARAGVDRRLANGMGAGGSGQVRPVVLWRTRPR
ncbi:glycosyltransferase 61 family protein [Jhaorihella thermophila]